MKDADARPQAEVDVLKFFIWLMVLMTVTLGVIFWILWNKLDAVKRNLELGKTMISKDSKDSFPKMQAEIQAMLNVYRNNKEDIARDQPHTWFSGVWRRKGINEASMNPGAWKPNPPFNPRGKYFEEQIDMTFNAKNPLPRQSITEFCHEIEKSSTRLRVIELEVRRTDRDNLEKDEWAGKAVVGYRHAR